MASETFSVRMYFALLLAGIAGFAALVIATVQSDIATATVSQEGLSVQLVVSSFCSILYRLTQMNILSGINDAYDGKALNTLRAQANVIQSDVLQKLDLVSGLTFNFPTEQATNMQLIADLKVQLLSFSAVTDLLDAQGILFLREFVDRSTARNEAVLNVLGFLPSVSELVDGVIFAEQQGLVFFVQLRERMSSLYFFQQQLNSTAASVADMQTLLQLKARVGIERDFDAIHPAQLRAQLDPLSLYQRLATWYAADSAGLGGWLATGVYTLPTTASFVADWATLTTPIVDSYQTQFNPIYTAKLSTQTATISGVVAAAVILLVACGLWMHFIGLSIQLPFDRLRLSRDGFVSETYGRTQARERADITRQRLSAEAAGQARDITEHDDAHRERKQTLMTAKLASSAKMEDLCGMLSKLQGDMLSTPAGRADAAELVSRWLREL